MKAFIKRVGVVLKRDTLDVVELEGEFRMGFTQPFPGDGPAIRAQIKALVWKTLSEVEIETPKDENTVLQERVTQLENRLCDLMSQMSRQEEVAQLEKRVDEMEQMFWPSAIIQTPERGCFEDISLDRRNPNCNSHL